MNGYKLTLELDDDDSMVWLIAIATNGKQQKDVVRLRDGFGIGDVRAAALATGWVRQDGDELHFTNACNSGVFGGSLSNLIADMFSYFNAANDPTDELHEVQSAVAEYEGVKESRLDIPPYAYAWLDIMLREVIADQARGSKDIWAKSEGAIELDRAREHWVAALLARYAQPSAGTVSRMAGSRPTRNRDTSRGTQTG